VPPTKTTAPTTQPKVRPLAKVPKQLQPPNYQDNYLHGFDVVAFYRARHPLEQLS
jgi:hypothetical protein